MKKYIKLKVSLSIIATIININVQAGLSETAKEALDAQYEIEAGTRQRVFASMEGYQEAFDAKNTAREKAAEVQKSIWDEQKALKEAVTQEFQAVNAELQERIDAFEGKKAEKRAKIKRAFDLACAEIMKGEKYKKALIELDRANKGISSIQQGKTPNDPVCRESSLGPDQPKPGSFTHYFLNLRKQSEEQLDKLLQPAKDAQFSANQALKSDALIASWDFHIETLRKEQKEAKDAMESKLAEFEDSLASRKAEIEALNIAATQGWKTITEMRRNFQAENPGAVSQAIEEALAAGFAVL